MFGNKEKEYNRFLVEKVGGNGFTRCYILTDKKTGIQYLSTWISTGGGVTPLLDENGNVTKVDVSKLNEK